MKVKILLNIIFITLISVSIPLSASEVAYETNETVIIDISYASYTRMSTEELQEALEILSRKDEYPLEMGMELFKRWTSNS